MKAFKVSRKWKQTLHFLHCLSDFVFSKELKCDQFDQFLQVSVCLHKSKNKSTQIQNRYSIFCMLFLSVMVQPKTKTHNGMT